MEDTNYGTLYDYDTGEELRPAKASELRASEEAEASSIGAGSGVIEVDGRRCFVER